MTNSTYRANTDSQELGPVGSYIADIILLFVTLSKLIYKKIYRPLIRAIAPYLFVASLIMLLGLIGSAENGSTNTGMIVFNLVLLAYSGIKAKIIK